MDKLTPGAASFGNVAVEIYIGNSRCIVCDDFCPEGVETRKRTQQSKTNIGHIWYEAEKAKLLRKSIETEA